MTPPFHRAHDATNLAGKHGEVGVMYSADKHWRALGVAGLALSALLVALILLITTASPSFAHAAQYGLG